MKPAFIMIGIGILLALYAAADSRANKLADIATGVMLQSMERGYQCHVAGRSLEDCQQEQRQRWANPVDLPPFGSRP